jgi:hypothetical protein
MLVKYSDKQQESTYSKLWEEHMHGGKGEMHMMVLSVSIMKYENQPVLHYLIQYFKTSVTIEAFWDS